MPDFSKRSEKIEVMDDLHCSGEVVHQTLRELEIINTWLGGNAVTLGAVKELIGQGKKSTPTLHICDLGCGGGDMLRLINKWASRKGLSVKLTGIDANPNIIDFAKANTPQQASIDFEPVDIFSHEFRSRKFDVVIGTLFFHHFSNDQLVELFRNVLKNTSTGLIINDIHRHWFAYYSIKWLTALFSRSSMVRYDAPLSVLRAFTRNELVNILKQAGVSRYVIRWKWAFRWQVIAYSQHNSGTIFP